MEGKSLEDLFRGRGLDIPQMLNRLKSVARDEGLPFGDRKMTFNSNRAQELAKFARDEGKENEFHHAVFKAYFVDGLNIADHDVLIQCMETSGMNARKGIEALEKRTYRPLVKADWKHSAEAEIQAVPSFLYNGKLLTGAHPYETMAKLLT